MEKLETIFEYEGALQQNGPNHYGIIKSDTYLNLSEGDVISLTLDDIFISTAKVFLEDGIFMVNTNNPSSAWSDEWSLLNGNTGSLALYIPSDTPLNIGTHKIELKKKIS